MGNPSNSINQNLLPVQAYFNVDGSFNTFIGQGKPFYATANPIQSGLTITNSTLDSSPIGSTSPSTGASNSVSTTSSFQAPVASAPSSPGAKPTPPTKAQIAAAVKTAQSNAESAKSMEDQTKTQNVVIGAMGYVQGFDAYNVTLKDAPFYKPYSIYGNQKTIDNRRASRGLFGSSDVKHDEMVQSQYR